MSAPKRAYRRGVPLEQSQPAEQVHVGEVDAMSRSAVRLGLPLCGRGHPGGQRLCTRAAGHDEGDRARGFSSQHCAAPDPNYIALEVWH